MMPNSFGLRRRFRRAPYRRTALSTALSKGVGAVSGGAGSVARCGGIRRSIPSQKMKAPWLRRGARRLRHPVAGAPRAPPPAPPANSLFQKLLRDLITGPAVLRPRGRSARQALRSGRSLRFFNRLLGIQPGRERFDVVVVA